MGTIDINVKPYVCLWCLFSHIFVLRHIVTVLRVIRQKNGVSLAVVPYPTSPHAIIRRLDTRVQCHRHIAPIHIIGHQLPKERVHVIVRAHRAVHTCMLCLPIVMVLRSTKLVRIFSITSHRSTGPTNIVRREIETRDRIQPSGTYWLARSKSIIWNNKRNSIKVEGTVIEAFFSVLFIQSIFSPFLAIQRIQTYRVFFEKESSKQRRYHEHPVLIHVLFKRTT